MATGVPSLTSGELRALARYFDGVDRIIGSRLSPWQTMDEEFLTGLLCEALDERTSKLHNLSYSFEQLQRDIAPGARPVSMSIQMEAKRYSRAVEHNRTYSDLGIIIRYRDVVPDFSFERGALFQAKRLYVQRGEFNLDCPFEAFSVPQLTELSNLQRKHGCPLCFYLFYLPLVEHFDARSREQMYSYFVRSQHEFDLDMDWYLSPRLRHRRLLPYVPAPDEPAIDETVDHIPSVLAGDIEWLSGTFLESEKVGGEYKWKPKSNAPGRITARDVVARLPGRTCSLSSAMVYGLLLGRWGCTDSEVLTLVRGGLPDAPGTPRLVLTLSVQVGTVVQ